jgi:hypothetical protein
MTENNDEQETPSRAATVTCHTDGCGNAEQAISLPAIPDVPEPQVICGVCGQQITDIT